MHPHGLACHPNCPTCHGRTESIPTGWMAEPVPGYDNDDELRRYALDEQRLHDPANQDGNNYERCEHCHYTRHPCDVHELATAVLFLLDRGRTDA
jgi:hypothetical protein